MRILFWVLFVLSGAIYLTMMLWTAPALLAEAEGLRPFDFRPMGYSFAEAQTYLSTLSEDGIAIYLGPQHLLDLFYPGVLAATFVVGFLSFMPPSVGRRWLWAAVAIAVIGAAADYTENRWVGLILTRELDPDLVARTSIATVVKSISATCCFVVLLGLGVTGLWNRLARRRQA